MRKVMRLTGGALSVVICLTTMLAAPAAARRHKHHRRHHVVCGAGTLLQDGVCVTTNAVGDSNVTITPNPVQMTLDGAFTASLTVTGISPTDVLTPPVTFGPVTFGPVTFAPECEEDCPPPPAPGSIPCGPTAAIKITPVPLVADAIGRATASLFSSGPCVPGTYPITLTESTSPFQTFTGFLILTF